MGGVVKMFCNFEGGKNRKEFLDIVSRYRQQKSVYIGYKAQ